MPNRKPRVLEEIKELLKSIDSKLDKLFDRQVSEDLGLGPRQKELLRQFVRRDAQLDDLSRFSVDKPSFGRNENAIVSPNLRPGIDQQSFVPGTFVSLQEHLRETMGAIQTCGEATALQVSEKTGRSRAAESDYLNQLVDRGFLKKERRGKEIIFQVFSLHTLCPMCGSRVPLNVKFCSFCGAPLYKREQSL